MRKIICTLTLLMLVFCQTAFAVPSLGDLREMISTILEQTNEAEDSITHLRITIGTAHSIVREENPLSEVVPVQSFLAVYRPQIFALIRNLREKVDVLEAYLPPEE